MVIFFFEIYFCDKNLKKNYLRELSNNLRQIYFFQQEINIKYYLRRQHVSGSIQLLRETKSQLSWSPNTDMSLCFRVHLNTQRGSIRRLHLPLWISLDLSIGLETPRLIKKKKYLSQLTFLNKSTKQI